uniref:Uncharacterized protein n=1 Tax=Aplanochytrium stocchinoi TaxID=215587 RepID=A0A7S3PB32_9STRA
MEVSCISPFTTFAVLFPVFDSTRRATQDKKYCFLLLLIIQIVFPSSIPIFSASFFSTYLWKFNWKFILRQNWKNHVVHICNHIVVPFWLSQLNAFHSCLGK